MVDSGEFDYCTLLFNIDLALNEVFRFNLLIPSQTIVFKKSDTDNVHLDGILCLSLKSPVLDGMLSVLFYLYFFLSVLLQLIVKHLPYILLLLVILLEFAVRCLLGHVAQTIQKLYENISFFVSFLFWREAGGC